MSDSFTDAGPRRPRRVRRPGRAVRPEPVVVASDAHVRAYRDRLEFLAWSPVEDWSAADDALWDAAPERYRSQAVRATL